MYQLVSHPANKRLCNFTRGHTDALLLHADYSIVAPDLKLAALANRTLSSPISFYRLWHLHKV